MPQQEGKHKPRISSKTTEISQSSSILQSCFSRTGNNNIRLTRGNTKSRKLQNVFQCFHILQGLLFFPLMSCKRKSSRLTCNSTCGPEAFIHENYHTVITCSCTVWVASLLNYMLHAWGHGNEPQSPTETPFSSVNTTEEVLANVRWLGFCHFQWENANKIWWFTHQTMPLSWVGFSLPKAKPTKYGVKEEYNGLNKLDKMHPSNCLNFPSCGNLGRQWSRKNLVILHFDGKRWLEENICFSRSEDS